MRLFPYLAIAFGQSIGWMRPAVTSTVGRAVEKKRDWLAESKEAKSAPCIKKNHDRRGGQGRVTRQRWSDIALGSRVCVPCLNGIRPNDDGWRPLGQARSAPRPSCRPSDGAGSARRGSALPPSVRLTQQRRWRRRRPPCRPLRQPFQNRGNGWRCGVDGGRSRFTENGALTFFSAAAGRALGALVAIIDVGEESASLKRVRPQRRTNCVRFLSAAAARLRCWPACQETGPALGHGRLSTSSAAWLL